MSDEQETLADIVAEMRKYKDLVIRDRKYPDRIEEAARREAAKLIPARNIQFHDGKGFRQVSCGWVKVGSEPLASRPATEQDMESGKAKWCSACATDCPLRGSDVLVICERFKESGVGK